MRWQGSTIRCYEPNPGTFAYLERNIKGRPNISATNAAVYPGVGRREPFFSRYDGDGEAGLVSYARDTFRDQAVMSDFDVDVVAPSDLASADIVKLDVEGAEGVILRTSICRRPRSCWPSFRIPETGGRCRPGWLTALWPSSTRPVDGIRFSTIATTAKI